MECGAPLRDDVPHDPAYGSRQMYTPEGLAEKIRAGSDALEGERKQISVLFADVVGSTALAERLDPEEVRALMRRLFDVILDAIHRFEGTVAQILGDGVLAFFGAPIAHEDHATRAIFAGLAIQTELRSLQEELGERGIDLRLRIGVHSGLVVFGAIGTDLEFTYQAVGDTTNTASRVQGLAEPGTVVVSDATHRLAEGYFVFQDLGERTVKNKAEPIHIFRAIRPTGLRTRVDVSAGHGLSPYVGRASELELLRERFDLAATGRGQVVFVSGEAGLGKSRLIHEFRERLADRDHLWLSGRCISYGAGIPYVPITDLTRLACGIEEADTEAMMATKLATRVAEVGGDPVHLPYLRCLLSIDPGDPSVAEEDPMMRKPRVFEAFREVLLAAVQREPAVIVVEDLHWIDPPSAELLSFIVESVPDNRLLLVLTHRPEWSPPFGERPFYSRIALEPLSEDDTAIIAVGTSGDSPLPRELAAFIYRKAEGNPFFIEEVTKSLLESGSVVRAETGYALARPLEEIDVPDTVQGVIMARLDRLDEAPRAALQTASVIGREFTSRLLERTAGTSSLDDTVRELKAVQLIFERTLYPELVFMFKHALTHEVAYGSLLHERRRVLHAAVAESIRELYTDRPAEVVETLAHHYERAELWVDAVHYLVGSADKAMAGFALDQALGYADRAVAAMERSDGPPDLGVLAYLHQIRGQCYELRNEWPAALACYREMVAAAEAGGDDVTRGFGLTFVSLAQIYAHQLVEGEETARVAESIAEEIGDPNLRALTKMALLFDQTVMGDLDAAYPQIEVMEQAARSAGDPFTRSITLDLAGEMKHMQSDEHRALALVEEALTIAEHGGLGQPLSYIYFDRILVTLALGRYDDAFAAARKSIAHAERVGDQGFWWCRGKNTLGRIYFELGDLERGALHNQEAVERALIFGDKETLRNAELNLGDCALGRGETDEALSIFEGLERAFAADAYPFEWMKWRYTQHLLMGLSQTWLSLGEAERALTFAEACLELAERTSTLRYISKGRRARGRALGSLGRTNDALEDVGVALRTAQRIGGPEPVWQAHGARAAILLGAGREAEARDAADEALAVVDAIAAALHEPGASEIFLASGEVRWLRAVSAG